jgi:hypothetical protein
MRARGEAGKVATMNEHDGGKLGFLDSLGRLFRAKEPEASAPAAPAADSFAELEARFDAVLRDVREKIAAQRRGAEAPDAGPRGKTAGERAAEREARIAACHRAIREDIEKMHARLGSGLAASDLDAIADFLKELHADASQGKDSHALMPRLRWAIASRLRAEAGALAVARIIALLQRAKLDWPDPTHYRPSATPEEIERSRRRRLAEVREAFLAQDLERLAERTLGVVRAWGGDYPERGSPLWQESVLEGVAAGIRGALMREFVERLRRDQALLLSRTESGIGKELAALQRAVASGLGSVEQANAVVMHSLHVIDEVVPEIAWEHLRAQLPSARGESELGA